MAQAGPSVPKRVKKKAVKHEVRSSKVKKVTEVKSIEALEESVVQYVSCLLRHGYLVRTHQLT